MPMKLPLWAVAWDVEKTMGMMVGGRKKWAGFSEAFGKKLFETLPFFGGTLTISGGEGWKNEDSK